MHISSTVFPVYEDHPVNKLQNGIIVNEIHS